MGDAGDPTTQLRRVHQDIATGQPVQTGVPDRGVDFGARRLPIEELDALTICGGLIGPGLELVDLIRLVGERQCPRLLEVAVDAVLAREGDQTVQVLDALPFEDVELVGKWRIPFARPWVRLASQKPPLRPMAP